MQPWWDKIILPYEIKLHEDNIHGILNKTITLLSMSDV